MPKYRPIGKEFKQGQTLVQQVKNGNDARVRITFSSGASATIDGNELFDLTELLDDVCDKVEDDELSWPM